MPGIGVILNPNSKRYKKDPDMARKMAFIVGDKASCKQTDDLPDLRRVAEEFKTRDIDILAISGGDGTNHCTLTTFIQVYGDKPLPKIAFLRGGTLNTVASSLGIKGSSENLLSRLLVKYHEDIPFQSKPITLMNVNGEYGFIFGIGVVFNFMENYYRYGALSPAGAAAVLSRTIFSAMVNGPYIRKMFERFDAEVTLNGKVWPFANYTSVFAGSTNQLGLNFRSFYMAFQNIGKFHAIGMALNARSILKCLPSIYRGVPNHSPDFLEEVTPAMTIKVKKPMGFTIDGDMKAPVDTFNITAGPTLNVLLP